MIQRRALLGGAALAPAALARPAIAQRVGLATLETKLDDTVAPGLRREVLIRWGDRVEFDAPPFTPASPSVDAAESQFGWDGRIIALVAPPAAGDGVPRAVLVVAHPTVNAAMAFPGGRAPPGVAQAMQGASVINLQRQDGGWVIVDGGFQTRRLHGRTLCRVTGPAQGAIGASVQGVLMPRGGCATPWGTVLLAEDSSFRRDGLGYGWIVEFDALEPRSVPAKRTALGRIAHGDAAAALTRDGRAVVYATDRRMDGFLYRFVSAETAGDGALDEGVLAVARIDGEALRWIALPEAVGTADPAQTARRAGGTPLEVPAGLALDPREARLFLACRGGETRGAGRVIEIIPAGGDHGAETGVVQPLLAGRASPPPPDPNARRQPEPIAAWPETPETLWADGAGQVFIGTDREGRIAALPDALYACGTGGDRGRAVALYGAPRGAAVGGAILTPDRRTLFVMVRRPGAERAATWERPGTTWPEFAPGMPPRSTLVALIREDGTAI